MEKKKEKKLEANEVLPLRDHSIYQNDVVIHLKKGESIVVPEKFLEVLKTEKVIN